MAVHEAGGGGGGGGTPYIEKKYVQGVYDAIAPHFSSTRYAKWPKVALFLNSLPPGSLALDAGCGNGKYLDLNSRCFFVGCDLSSPLTSICSQRGHEVIVADTLRLPYRGELFDAAISIAVLHHLSTVDRRRKAIEEMARVVAKGGRILITVWAVEQEDKALISKWTPLTLKYSEEWVGDAMDPKVTGESRNAAASLQRIEENESLEECLLSDEDMVIESVADTGVRQEELTDSGQCEKRGNGEQQDFFVPWHLPYHRAEIGGTSAAVASGFAKRDEKKAAIVYNRYYHVFVEGELERLVSGIDGIFILEKFYDKSNWCMILCKT